MRLIWKYDIQPDCFVIMMPEGARVLDVATHRERAFLWALVDPNAVKVPRRFVSLPTGGHGFSDEIDEFIFVGTFRFPGLVFHLFDAGIEVGTVQEIPETVSQFDPVSHGFVDVEVIRRRRWNGTAWEALPAEKS